ncbi:MAG TPA: alpha/beta hydrolase, partial [Armatimonadota bacterium]|nr:alpha/beta hydrolase [Armatimonadota bacterium]
MSTLLQDIWENRFVRRILLPFCGLYIVLLLIGVFFSDSLIFNPGNHSGYHDDSSIVKLITADGMKISAQFLPNEDAKYTILYSHGNGEDLGEDESLLTGLHDLGFSVFAYDYHGYGTSEGKPCETTTYQDINTAYRYLTTTRHIPTENIIVYGRSLGGGPSVDLASRKPVGGLILQSCFATAFRARTQIALLPFDKFRSIDKIGRVRCPVLIMHGKSDYVIPFHHGVQLYNAVKTPKLHFWVNA